MVNYNLTMKGETFVMAKNKCIHRHDRCFPIKSKSNAKKNHFFGIWLKEESAKPDWNYCKITFSIYIVSLNVPYQASRDAYFDERN